MKIIDFTTIVRKAWKAYDPDTPIRSIMDISAMVSTNHVYKIRFVGRRPIIAKLSFFGRYGHFKEDHSIINFMARKLPEPYKNFLARSLSKHKQVFTYRDQDLEHDAWVVFYKPIRIQEKLPPRLDEHHIVKLAHELALFHKACTDISPYLPSSSKSLKSDIIDLYKILDSAEGKFEFHGHCDFIRTHCETFLKNIKELSYKDFPEIPVFVDWNIGNFSITKEGKFFSRWDYDWFRISSRVLDFYFFSRVTSDIGDRTSFSYWITTFMEERFLLFLKEYHSVFPLTSQEVYFMKEAYRFFILNYVIKYGKHFFHTIYATKLQKEAYDIYLREIDQKFDADRILKALNL